MFIGRLEKDHLLNFGISYDRDWRVNPCRCEARTLRIWCFSFETYPKDGDTIDSAKLSGFYREWRFCLPFSPRRARVFITSRYANPQDNASQAKKENEAEVESSHRR